MGGYRRILFTSASLLTFALSGCMDDTASSGDAAGEATAFSERPASSRLVERDVEAPEVFQTTDKGLWDGRPSLGGVWVAYPDVTDPERVIIRNDSNGKFVIGALFKREREHPGPLLQVSSDAAAALGMLAGAPTTLNVTALRREEPAPVAAPAEEPVAETAPAAAAAAVASAGDALESTDDVAVGSAEGATAAVIEAEPKKRGWNPFRRKAAKAEEAVAADLELAAANASAGADAAESADAAIKSAETAIETAADDAVAPVVEAIEPAKTKRSWNPFRRKPKDSLTPAAAAGTSALATDAITAQSLDAAPRVADAAAAAPEARATNSKLEEPYVQIGIFSLEANANDTATALRQNGVVPHVYKQESSGKSFWRVVAGPSNSKVDRAALIKKVKEMGFTDAYPVRG